MIRGVAVSRRLLRVVAGRRLLNFMVVGTLGFLLSMIVYYPLTLLLQYHTTFLGQVFYLPALLPASFISITFNYYLNKKVTFRDCETKRMSYARYLLMCLTTTPLDLTIIVLLVQFAHLYYMLAVVLAVLCMFLVRYSIATHWVWYRRLK